MGQMLVQAENFRKKVSVPAYPAFACAVKAHQPPVLKLIREGCGSSFPLRDDGRLEGQVADSSASSKHGAGRSIDGLEQDAPAT
jgi:hypothetical protein